MTLTKKNPQAKTERPAQENKKCPKPYQFTTNGQIVWVGKHIVEHKKPA